MDKYEREKWRITSKKRPSFNSEQFEKDYKANLEKILQKYNSKLNR